MTTYAYKIFKAFWWTVGYLFGSKLGFSRILDSLYDAFWWSSCVRL